MIRGYKYRLYPTEEQKVLLASNNIKKFAFINIKNTAGIVGINACGDGAVALSEKQEAQPIANGVGG